MGHTDDIQYHPPPQITAQSRLELKGLSMLYISAYDVELLTFRQIEMISFEVIVQRTAWYMSRASLHYARYTGDLKSSFAYLTSRYLVAVNNQKTNTLTSR
jgi:hypothetical protein